ncbi:MAG: hypothetical protein KAR16_04950 [Bacteroidales bacterium]|nr:hypothetical protein [Bacteroidales bacterium]
MGKRSVTSLLFLAFVALCPGQSGFKESQQSYPRVREAYREKWEGVAQLLEANGLDPAELELYLVAYKQEKKLETWARSSSGDRFEKLNTYNICQTSGEVGPKRRQGDLQIPEGFYHISAYNPWSSFHLSICINYPNRSDRILGVQGNLGGDICIHGSCVTIGCLPLTDEVIKELYILCVEAKSGGQMRIPITIYPARLNRENFDRLLERYSDDADRVNLWSDLLTAYNLFQSSQRLPEITFLPDGRHTLK